MKYAVNNDFLLNPNAENMAFWKGFTKDELEWILWCPMVRYPPNDANLLQNTINCGKWFKPNRPDGSMVPASLSMMATPKSITIVKVWKDIRCRLGSSEHLKIKPQMKSENGLRSGVDMVR